MLNQPLLHQTEPDRFCTAVYALLEPRFGRMHVTLASGGHPVPYVIRSNGTLEPLQAEGTLLGVVPDPGLAEVSVDLDFGDKLILYTDGIIDIRSTNRHFGPRQLEELFAECGKRGAEGSGAHRTHIPGPQTIRGATIAIVFIAVLRRSFAVLAHRP